MQNFSAYPREMIASFWRNHSLIWILTKQEINGRYQGSYFGILWALINPLILLGIYTFVFSEVFKARWTLESDSKVEFALLLFLGLLVLNIFSECINKSPLLIVSNIGYVKKVVFPLEILSYVSVGVALFHWAVGILMWLLAYMIFVGMPPMTIVFLPLVIAPLTIFLLGVSWILAVLGVFYRDLPQITGLIVTALMFLAPIFYPITSVPEQFRFLISFNPLTPIIEEMRTILYWGKSPNLTIIGLYFFAGILLSLVGFSFFKVFRKYFSDAL